MAEIIRQGRPDGSSRVSVVVDGKERVLGCKLPDRRKMGAGRQLADAGIDLLPPTMWQEVDFSANYGVAVRNQGDFSSCVGESSTESMEWAWQIAGNEPRSFSPWFTYSQINGGVDQGAMVSDAVRALRDKGVCLDTSVPFGTILADEIPPSAYQEALRFRVDEWFELPSFAHAVTALHHGIIPVFGLVLDETFMDGDLDADGFVPAPSGVPVGGHAQMAYGTRLARNGPFKGTWGLRTRNSWGASWGDGGSSTIPASYFTFQQPSVDCFGIRAVRIDPLAT